MVERKRILTMFWYDDASEVHLYKDVGGIPYALAKYHGWEATLAYNDLQGIIHNDDYEQYVKLEPIHYPKICARLKLRYYKYLKVMYYVWKNAPHYDVINFYHVNPLKNLLCFLAKKSNPSIITYVKCDMGREGFVKEQNSSGGVQCWADTDLFTIETKKYVLKLNLLNKYRNRIKYLPNGFFDVFDTSENNYFGGFPLDKDKEHIILTVGRLGTYQKNTEMLVEAFCNLKRNKKLEGWKLYLIGDATSEFKEFLSKICESNSKLVEDIILIGRIDNKRVLAGYYNQASLFVMPSRFESWGLVVSEAMHYANYVILTDVCDAFYDMTENGKYCTLIRSEDEKGLQEAILCFVNNYDKCMKLAKIGSKFVDNNFNWRSVSKSLEHYFCDLMNEK